jgi:hypothetical protein
MSMRWFAVFDQALRSNDVIAVWRVVEQHLDRPLTRAELTAARRAANRYAVAAKVRIIRVPEPAGSGGIRTIPILARLDADLDDVERLSAIAAGTIATGGGRRRTSGDVGERATSLVGTVATAARRARRLPVAKLDADRAASLADELSSALSLLHDLEKRLQTASIEK